MLAADSAEAFEPQLPARAIEARGAQRRVPMIGALPLVSIVVPSWQKGAVLHYALESLTMQTYRNLEIIVHDNCSTDETASVLRAFEPRLARVVRERDRGQSDALARGFGSCRGTILGWLNADDILMPGAIEQAVDALESESRPDVVYGHTAFLTEDGQFSGYFYGAQPFSAHRLRNFGVFIAQPSAFFRRTSYERAGGVDPSLHYAMDWDLWCRMARSGGAFQFVNEVWSGTRMYADTKTASGGWRRAREILQVNRRHKTRIVPLAAAAHFLGDVFPGRESPVSAPLRAFWRCLIGTAHAPEPVVHGVARSGFLRGSRARISFPLFDRMAGARLRLRWMPTDPAPDVRAILNGVPGECRITGEPGIAEARWVIDSPAYVPSVVLEIERLEEPEKLEGLELASFRVFRPGSPDRSPLTRLSSARDEMSNDPRSRCR